MLKANLLSHKNTCLLISQLLIGVCRTRWKCQIAVF